MTYTDSEAMLLATSDWFVERKKGLCFSLEMNIYVSEEQYLSITKMLHEVYRPDANCEYYWGTPVDLFYNPEARLLGGCLLAYLIETGDIEEFCE